MDISSFRAFRLEASIGQYSSTLTIIDLNTQDIFIF
jgi:hypothetical protein